MVEWREANTMRLTDTIFFYRGSPTISENPRQGLYRGMGSSNFLVLKDQSQLMVDSGFNFGPHRKRIYQEMATDGIDITDTSQVIFSHAHPDHIQHAKFLARAKYLKFSMHEDNELYTRNGSFHFEAYFNYPLPIKREILFLPTSLARLGFKLLGLNFDYIRADQLFASGMEIDWGGGIKIIGLPGHCTGHVGFYFPHDRLLYAADTLFESDSAYPVLPCVTNALSSLAHGLADIERISKLDIDFYVPGHGKVLAGAPVIKKVLDAARDNTLRLMENALTRLQAKRQTLSELTHALFNGANNSLYGFNIAIVYQVLVFLRNQGKVSVASQGRKMIWQAC